MAVSIAFGVIPAAIPEFYDQFPEGIKTVFESGITAASVSAILLNIVFNILGRGEEQPSYTADATSHVPTEEEVRSESR